MLVLANSTVIDGLRRRGWWSSLALSKFNSICFSIDLLFRLSKGIHLNFTFGFGFRGTWDDLESGEWSSPLTNSI